MQSFYTVQAGDTLNQVAVRWKIGKKSIIVSNNLHPLAELFVGQQLSIPPEAKLEVTAKEGETVFQLAEEYRVPAGVVILANRLLFPYIIKCGQVLRIPVGAPSYIVEFGDTLEQIAARYNVVRNGKPNIELLCGVNGLNSVNLVPGMKLVIPKASCGD